MWLEGSDTIVALEKLAQAAHPLGKQRFPGKIEPSHATLAMHELALRLRREIGSHFEKWF